MFQHGQELVDTLKFNRLCLLCCNNYVIMFKLCYFVKFQNCNNWKWSSQMPLSVLHTNVKVWNHVIHSIYLLFNLSIRSFLDNCSLIPNPLHGFTNFYCWNATLFTNPRNHLYPNSPKHPGYVYVSWLQQRWSMAASAH